MEVLKVVIALVLPTSRQFFLGTNVLYEGEQMIAASRGDCVSVDFVLDLPILRSGFYHFSPAVADGTMNQYEHCDWIDNAFALEVLEQSATYGHIRVPVRTDHRLVSRARVRVQSQK